MKYGVIRASENYLKVILVSPPVSEADYDENSKFYLVDEKCKSRLKRIPSDQAIGYFSGHMDGMGYGNVTDQIFYSAKEIIDWVKKSYRQYRKQHPFPKRNHIRDSIQLYRLDPERFIAYFKRDLRCFRRGHWTNPRRRRICSRVYAKRMLKIAEKVGDKRLLRLAQTFSNEANKQI